MASVTFKRGTRAEIEATAKQDGQILMETDQNKKNKMYIDLPDGRRVLIGNSGEAIDTSYDNTTSGLDATNVQNAIDKIESNVGDISGITDSLTATSSNIALSAAGGNNLQGQIDTLNSNFDNVLAWTRINDRAVKGSTSVSIPSWAKEVQVSIDVNNEFRYTSTYPITSLEDNGLICVVGSSFYKYNSAEEISYASVNISKKSVNMRNVILNNVDVKDKSYMVIYCR